MKKITVKRAVIAVILTAVCMAAAAIPNAAALTLPTEVDPAAAVLSNKTAAYLQGGALYVKCGECVELTLVASGVEVSRAKLV